MKKNIRFIYLPLVATIAALSLNSCTKEKYADLGAKPSIDFAMIPGSNPNNITLVNKSATPVIPYWKLSTSTNRLSGDSAVANFVFSGNYTVTMYGIGHGGIDSITKPVVIAQTDPTACVNTQQGFLAGCTSKTWKLNPAAGAYKVGDAGPGAGNWWTSPATEPAARICEFNDTYTFSFDKNGTFVYDNKGDFYGDGYMGDNTGTCQPTSNYNAVQAPWGSGTFTYTFTTNGGVNKLGQITVNGLGAHIGIQKARNGGEVQSPASSITYDILSATHDPAGYDLMQVGVNLGYGWWSFTLRSQN